LPWTTRDVDRHVKGLTAHQKKVWVNVANSALSRCEADGGDDCERDAGGQPAPHSTPAV